MWAGGLAEGEAFDCNGPSACLVGALSRFPKPPRNSTALVPGCGRGYDCVALAAHGFDQVIGLELSPSAAAAAREHIAGSPHAAKITIEVGDFFAPEVLSGVKFDLVWDATSFCAIQLEARADWASVHARLLKPGGVLWTCIFPISPGKVDGPPFSVDVAACRSVLEPAGVHTVEVVEKVVAGEEHRPGGMPAGAKMGTGFASWEHSGPKL